MSTYKLIDSLFSKCFFVFNFLENKCMENLKNKIILKKVLSFDTVMQKTSDFLHSTGYAWKAPDV